MSNVNLQKEVVDNIVDNMEMAICTAESHLRQNRYKDFIKVYGMINVYWNQLDRWSDINLDKYGERIRKLDDFYYSILKVSLTLR